MNLLLDFRINNLVIPDCVCSITSVTLLLFFLDPGIVFYYVVLQVTLWWFFHVSSLFWKMKFPLHAIAAESARQIKYVHLTMVVLGLILPLVPVIATLTTSGFGINRFPPILCFGANLNATFYTTIFPIMLFLQVGITLLVVSFWTVHKVYNVINFFFYALFSIGLVGNWE